MIIDDFAPISCSILSSQSVDGHTEYELECRRHYGHTGEATKSWTTNKRFSDFVNLDSSLSQAGSQVNLNLPKKKIVGNMGIKDKENDHSLLIKLNPRQGIYCSKAEGSSRFPE